MSDMPKNLRAAAGLRWILLTTALLLTVAAGTFGWIETVDQWAPAPRAFVLGLAMVAWVAWVALSCAVLVVQRICKRICRAEARILEAIAAARLANLADAVENGNIRSINERR
jgi:hypothetical protein